MDKINKWLKDYGLNDTEITVYLCIMKYPEIRVVDIQRETGLVRTTIYYTLAQLKSGGLISENLQNNVKTYRAAKIESFKNKIESDILIQKGKLEQLDKISTEFESLISPGLPENSTFIARFEGIGPVKQAIEDAMRCESKRWHIIASRDNFLLHCSKRYQNYYLQERKRRGITAKTLWEPTDEKTDFSLEEIFYRNPRRLPEDFRNTFKSLIIIYDQTTLIIDPYDKKTAYAINNSTSTNLLRLLHEFVWKYTEHQAVK